VKHGNNICTQVESFLTNIGSVFIHTYYAVWQFKWQLKATTDRS